MPDARGPGQGGLEDDTATLWSIGLIVLMLFSLAGIVYYFAFSSDDTLFHEGNHMLEVGENEAAIRLYEAALGTRVSDPEQVHNNLAIAYHRLGEVNAAMQHWRAAVSVRPGAEGWYSIVSRFNLANCLRSEGAVDEPMRHYRYLTRLNATCIDVSAPSGDEAHLCPHVHNNPAEFLTRLSQSHLFLGILLREQGRLPEAETELKRALAVDPHMIDILFQLALLHHVQGRAKSATHYLRRCAKESPSSLHMACYALLGNYSEASGDRKRAAQFYRKALALKPNYVFPQGRLHQLEGEPLVDEPPKPGDQINFMGATVDVFPGVGAAARAAFDAVVGPMPAQSASWFDVLEVGAELGLAERHFADVANTLAGTYAAYGERNQAKASGAYVWVRNEDPMSAVQGLPPQSMDVLLVPYAAQQLWELRTWMAHAFALLREDGFLIAAFILPPARGEGSAGSGGGGDGGATTTSVPSDRGRLGIRLQPDRMLYAHTQSYVETAAQQAGFTARHRTLLSGSFQGGDVEGALYVFEKAVD